ncbi:MAG: hypothetical protein RRA92_06985 [Gemmatimonadota bacterium]|nr:hypothetical protein [Gemmatimonadota bacterium]
MNGSHAIDADLARRLRALAGSVPPDEISELWVFPPLAAVEDSREFVVLTRLLPDGMRRVCAAELPPCTENGTAATPRAEAAVPAQGNGDAAAGPALAEFGRVPSGRVGRVVEGFRRRLGDAMEPIHLRIEGRAEAWDRALAPEAAAG